MSGRRVAIIGGGIVGTALFRELCLRGHEVYLLDRHVKTCEETSTRNSGVLHAGLYYPSNCLKTTLCVEGNRLFREYAKSKNLSFWDCGKLLIGPASAEAEIERIFKQSQDNGVPGCRIITQKEIRKMEPDVAGDIGIFSATSAIFDPHTAADAFVFDGEAAGGMIILECVVEGIEPRGNAFLVKTDRDDIEVDVVINSAGLEAIEVAKWVGVREYTYHYCRGDYFFIQGGKLNIQHLIYSTPDPVHQSLGVHITPDPNGRVRIGPDAEYVESHVHVKDGAEHKKQAFFEQAQKLIPSLKLQQLAYDMWGIRPKLKPPEAHDMYDFVIKEHPTGIIHLIGIESPGLTAAMAIGKYVGDRFLGQS